jgi:tousled-like kinase
MSAATSLQMAPQSAIAQVNQNPNHSLQLGAATPTTPTTTTSAQNQDSNMSTGSSHSDKDNVIDRDVLSQAIINTTPEKLPRPQSERKRKRKPVEDNGGGPVRTGVASVNELGRDGVHSAKGQRITLSNQSNDNKKINDYFHSKHSANRQVGAKSPSPQHAATFQMFPPSPQPPPPHHVHSLNASNSDYFKSRATAPPQPTSSVVPSVTNNLMNLTSSSGVSSLCTTGTNSSLVVSQQQSSPQSNHLIHLHNQNSQQSLSLGAAALFCHKSVQTDLSLADMQDRENDIESNKLKYEDLTRVSDEQKTQITAHNKALEEQKSHINKCIEVVKNLLKQKSNIEKKEARQKCMQNRLRLGQFVTQRVGATFQENWTDGYAFQELARRQEEIALEREEIDRQKKSLVKKRPTNTEGGRKRNTSSTSSTPTAAISSTSSNIHNGGDVTFLKPEPVGPSSSTFTIQEYYECDEILKLRHNALKKEDADLQLEMEKLERERNLHIRELKRIHNEDQV